MRERLDEQVHPVCLEPLTPVHVGSGETMDPMSYIMREEDEGTFLYTIDLEAWVEDQANPQELAEFFQNRSLPEIRGYLAHNVDPDIYALSSARVVSRDVFEKYRANLQDKESANQLLIDDPIRNPRNGALFIPGSSIKGAIRTTIIDYLDRECGLELNRRELGQDMNRALTELFGPPNKPNTFQDLKVGDFEARVDEARVFTAREVRRNQRDSATTPKNDCLATPALCTEEKAPRLYSTLTLGRVFGKDHHGILRVRYNGRTYQWDLLELLQECTRFYRSRYWREKERFYKQPHLRNTDSALEVVDDALNDLAQDEMLLRVGHYSHVECVTVTNNKPGGKTSKHTGRPIYGTTRTLAHGLHPFGWVKLRLCSWEEYEQALRDKREHDKQVLRSRELAREQIRQKAAEQARQLEEQRRKEREEEERRQRREQELAAMSEEERLVVFVESGEAIDNQVDELYFKLDQLDDELRVRAARAIKGRWQQQKKKWTGKLSPKQKKKVVVIQGILGEE
jgi:CRISPR/Cas system CSM-associated protein Csm5 (group 7 of RAMP superfamily)